MAGLVDFILPGSDPNTPNSFVQTPEMLARQQQLAQALMQEGGSTAPIRSPWQGVGNLAKALMGGWQAGQAQRGQRLGMANAAARFGNALGADPGALNIPATPGQTTPALQASNAQNDAITDGGPRAALAAALGGGSAPAPTSASPALAAALGGAPQAAGMAPYQAAIAKVESGGNYGALGPPTSRGDRAYGKYQVMGANIPQWTQAALGRPMTPQEFLASPQAQDAVFNHQFGGYVQKYGPQNAASMWLTGRTLGNGGAGAADQLGTTGQGYADQFTRNLGSPPASAAISGATAPHVPTWAEVEADNAAGAANIAARTSPAMAAGASLSPGGPQGAGVPPSPAPSQAGNDRLSPEAMASPTAQPAVPSPAPAPPAPVPPPAAAAPPPAAIPPAAAAPSPQGAQSPFHPNVQSLLNVLSDPWATPAQQQIAQSLLSAQMPTPPTFGVIGKDVAGNEQYGWINPKTQTVTPAGPGALAGAGAALPEQPGASPASAPPAPGAPATPQPQTVAGAVNMGAANGLTPQGATYLDGMEKQGGSGAVVARQARAIIEGNAPLPEANAATKPIDVAIRDAVLRAAPGFNSSLAAARVEAVKSFADKTSPASPGGMILAANKALHHLSALADTADKLGNTGSPVWNATGNFVKEWTVGSPELKAYNFNKEALAQEVAKIYKGGTPAEAEIHAMVASLSPNMTPAEQRAVFSKVSTLLQGATTELQRQWQSAFGPNSTYPVIGEEGQRIVKRFAGGEQPATAAAPAPAPVSSVKTPEDVAKLPSGTRFLIPDGSGRIGVAP